MKWVKRVLVLILIAALSGCARSSADQAVLDRELDAQLGLLAEAITDSQRKEAMNLWIQARGLREKRLERGEYEKSSREESLLEKLNGLYEAYTIQYLGGDGLGWGYANPEEEQIARYRIKNGEQLALLANSLDLSHGPWTQEDLEVLWGKMVSILPDGAFDSFIRFCLFTDGEGETMAYVQPWDNRGRQWELYLDPADQEDEELFLETVLHEYCHYLTLNDTQVRYSGGPNLETYCEEGLFSLPDSYLNDFYHRFWTDYLDDRLANMDSYNFFLRHEDDFVSAYASTDPSEDISESFSFFVLWGRGDGESVWSQKVNFFYDYPELVEFRAQVRENLGLDSPAQAA